eukprot:jgi/Chlat1/7652/Chrsp64S09159
MGVLVARPLLWPRCLVKSAVETGGVPLSPASAHGCRVAVQAADESGSIRCFVATGATVLAAQVSNAHNYSLREGKEGLLVPTPIEPAVTTPLGFAHEAEVQSVALREQEAGDAVLLGTVDACGTAKVASLSTKDGEMTVSNSLTLTPPKAEGVEAGWAGLAFADAWPVVATAHRFGRRLDLYQGDRHLRTMYTPTFPTAIAFLSAEDTAGSNTIVVTEGCQAVQCLGRKSGRKGWVRSASDR